MVERVACGVLYKGIDATFICIFPFSKYCKNLWLAFKTVIAPASYAIVLADAKPISLLVQLQDALVLARQNAVVLEHAVSFAAWCLVYDC